MKWTKLFHTIYIVLFTSSSFKSKIRLSLTLEAWIIFLIIYKEIMNIWIITTRIQNMSYVMFSQVSVILCTKGNAFLQCYGKQTPPTHRQIPLTDTCFVPIFVCYVRFWGHTNAYSLSNRFLYYNMYLKHFSQAITIQSVVCLECHQCMLLGLVAILARSMADVMPDVNLSSGGSRIYPRC